MENVENKECQTISIVRRNQIISKDFIRITEFAELLGVGYSVAQKIMAKIKRNSSRTVPQGYIHIQDYIEYYNLPMERYLLSITIQPGAIENA